MNSSHLLQQLKTLGSEQTRKTYARHGITGDVYGVSFAHLNKLKNQIKQNHACALELWQSGNFDARCLALMIAQASKASPHELEQWMQDITSNTLADMLAGFIQKTAYAHDYMHAWIAHDNEYYQVTGWGILAAMARDNAAELSDSYFEPYLLKIHASLQVSKNATKHAMNRTLIAIGSRNQALKVQAQQIAREIGVVVVDHGQTACKTPDAYDYIERVWARKKT